jgi:D-alanine-D-alanine ligase
MKKIHIGVLFGGRSGEHDVSLMSASSVLAVLDPQKYEVVSIGITREGKWVTGAYVLEDLLAGKTESLTQVAILPEVGHKVLYTIEKTGRRKTLQPLCDLDVIFPLLHGTFGEDGTLQGLLEMAGVAYVGAGVLASSVGMDKALFKDVMRANEVPVLDSFVVSSWQVFNWTDEVITLAEALAPYPLFIKPANLGSSVGISKCKDRTELRNGLFEAARYDRRVLVERGINAREIEVAVLGNDHPEAAVPGEIRPLDEFYTYKAKYQPGGSNLMIPAPLDRPTMDRFQELAIIAFRAVDCAGMARIDFLWDKDTGEIYISEINTIPGFTQTSMYPKLWEASGLLYPALIDRLVDLALERKAQNDLKRFDFTPPA